MCFQRTMVKSLEYSSSVDGTILSVSLDVLGVSVIAIVVRWFVSLKSSFFSDSTFFCNCSIFLNSCTSAKNYRTYFLAPFLQYLVSVHERLRWNYGNSYSPLVSTAPLQCSCSDIRHCKTWVHAGLDTSCWHTFSRVPTSHQNEGSGR